MTMENHQLQKLRDLPIEGVAQRLGLEVNRHKSLCPFHDDHHASLSYHVGRNTYRCFVCDAHGDVIDLVMRLMHLGFGAACRWLANDNCIVVTRHRPAAEEQPQPFDADRYARFFERPFINGAARRFLFEERQLDARVIEWCRITSWCDRHGTSWLQTPFYDTRGRLVGMQSRNLDHGKGLNHLPKFLFPQGAGCTLYNMPVLNHLQAGEDLCIAEGCSDCWAMLSSGLKAIAIPSATLLKPRDKQLLQALAHDRQTRFHAFPDNDTPGERLFLQLREILPGIIRHTLPPGCKDFSEWYLMSKAGNNPPGNPP